MAGLIRPGDGGTEWHACRAIAFVTVCALLAPLPSAVSGAELPWQVSQPRPHAEYHPSRLIVRYRPSAVATVDGERFVPLAPGRSIVRWTRAVSDTCVMSVPEGDVKSVIAELSKDPNVLYAEPDYKMEFTGLPSDEFFLEQWAILNTGQTVDNDPGLAGVDIRALDAWGFWTGDPDFKVAVVDTGVAWTHPDLQHNIWTNPAEIPDNGIDDDENGWIDDIHGYNMAFGNSVPFDTDGHGTHVAGIIGAEGNNNRGVAGINWDCQIVALKVGSARDGAYTSAILEAIDYMLANDIRVSNNSYGCYDCYSQALDDAIGQLEQAGHIFVTAAGNGFLGLGTNNDLFPFYPASYDHENVIAVASLNNNDRKPKSSNFGPGTVEIGAPGVNILSTYLNNGYAYLDGTSMATAEVTGAVALTMSRRPEMPWQNVRQRIVLTARPVNALQGRVISNGMLDLGAAVADCNDNGIVDEEDIGTGTSVDCNHNDVPDECEPDCNGTGIADTCDIDLYGAADCDGNRIPDECEADCNGNGMADACDISGGGSGDCNHNAVPDECEFGFATDCNANGTDDLCDIANETSFDCNGNGVPDECDIGLGSSLDCTGNGLPDECERDCNHNGRADSCDILLGVSQDQDADGIPDECVLGFAMRPVSANVAYTIKDREILLPRATPARVTLELTVSGWDPDQDGNPRVRTYQVAVEPSSFSNGVGAPLSIALVPCTDNDDCMATSECLASGVCDVHGSYDVDESNPNFIFAGIDSITGTDLSTLRAGGTLFEINKLVIDRGEEKYLATLILDVPADADGTYVVAYRQVDTFLDSGSANGGRIMISGFLPAKITILPDCNNNGVPDPTDILNETSEDCDGNGVPDECVTPEEDCNGNLVPDVCDIAEGFALDCNGNGIPDDCTALETDCNHNGFPDDCDISYGLSADCNGNGIPDDCIYLESDCNHNHLPDACDIAFGILNDCNHDGIPDVCQTDCNRNGLADECDIAEHRSTDIEHNGIPDECQHVLFVPDEYPTIQSAIDAAGSGDHVVLADGVYSGPGNVNIDFAGKTVTVGGEHGPESCVIDVTGQDLGVTFFNHEGFGTILQNVTISGAGNAGIAISDASPTIRHCIIEDNGPISSGVLVMRQSTPLFDHCVIRQNTANFSGGGIRIIDSASPVIRRCVIEDNISGDLGGGIYAASGNTQIVNTTITGNTAASGGGGIAFRAGAPSVEGSTIRGNRAKPATGVIGDGGGISSVRANALVANTLIEGNESGNTGGGVYLEDGDTRFVNCTVIGNTAQAAGGGVYQTGDGRDVWACCLFESCQDLVTQQACAEQAGVWYPGLDCQDVTCGTQSCCLPDDTCANLTYLDCLAAGGEPHLTGTQCSVADCHPTIGNSIVWRNRALTGLGPSVWSGGPFLEVMHSIVEGSWPGPRNTFSDPDFVQIGDWAPDGTWITGDHRLLSASAGVNSGRNATATEATPADLDGHPRILCGQVDRGAYERGIGDVNCDNVIDLLDFAYWPACMTGVAGNPIAEGCRAFDTNADGGVSLADYAAFQNLFLAESP